MANNRRAIRERIVAILKAANTIAGDRVFETRIRPIWQESLPAISVYTEQETISMRSVSPRRYLRTLTVAIDCAAEGKADLDDTLDALSAQVENALELDATLIDVTHVSDFWPRSAEMLVAEEPGAKLTGICRLKFDIEYMTAVGYMALENLDTISAKFDLAPAPDGQVDAAISVDLSDTHGG